MDLAHGDALLVRPSPGLQFLHEGLRAERGLQLPQLLNLCHPHGRLRGGELNRAEHAEYARQESSGWKIVHCLPPPTPVTVELLTVAGTDRVTCKST
ncbi:MAG: hypothetical protein ACYSW2_20530, partial [Planctomycetota bacterium]